MPDDTGLHTEVMRTGTAPSNGLNGLSPEQTKKKACARQA